MALALLAAGCTGSGSGEVNDTSPGATTQLLTPLEVGQRVGACVADQGLPVEVSPEGDVNFESEIEEEHALFAKYAEACNDELIKQGLVAAATGTPEFWEAEYERLQAVADCVRAEGYDVDDPPTLAVYVESQGAAWHPYSQVQPQSQAEIDELNAICPQ